MTTGNLLMKGMLVGLLAGLLAFGFGKVFGEPQVDRAIQVESQLHSAAHAAHGGAAQEDDDPELFSRDVQGGIGLLTGAVVYSAGLGGLFSLVFAYAYGRVGRFGSRALSALLAGLGFISIILVPMLKYPANPPAVGEPDTIGLRTAVYFGMVVLSLAAMVIATKLTRHTAPRLGKWQASILGGATFVIMAGMAMSFLPTINEVPKAFPADLLWNFRIASLGMQLIIWTTLGLAFGAWVERSQQANQHTGKIVVQ